MAGQHGHWRLASQSFYQEEQAAPNIESSQKAAEGPEPHVDVQGDRPHEGEVAIKQVPSELVPPVEGKHRKSFRGGCTWLYGPVIGVLFAIGASAMVLGTSFAKSELMSLAARVKMLEVNLCHGANLSLCHLPNFPDFAQGAFPVPSLTSTTSVNYQRTHPVLWPFGKLLRFPRSPTHNSPHLALHSSTQFNNCFRLGRVYGHLGVAFPVPIMITHVTIDHLMDGELSHMKEAPREMVLWGLVEGAVNFARHASSLPYNVSTEAPVDTPPEDITAAVEAINPQSFFIALARFEYDIVRGTCPVQTFSVRDIIKESQMDFGVVVLEVRENWGSNDTCLYRMRIHGRAAELEEQ